MKTKRSLSDKSPTSRGYKCQQTGFSKYLNFQALFRRANSFCHTKSHVVSARLKAVTSVMKIKVIRFG